MYKAKVNDKDTIHIEFEKSEWLIKGKKAETDLIKTGNNSFHLILNGNSYRINTSGFSTDEKKGSITVNGNRYDLTIGDKYDQLLKDLGIEQAGGKKAEPIKSPMPGLVLKVNVSAGDEVKEGDQIIILEAMKMENVIKAPADAKVKAVKVNQNDSVEKGHVLIEFE